MNSFFKLTLINLFFFNINSFCQEVISSELIEPSVFYNDVNVYPENESNGFFTFERIKNTTSVKHYDENLKEDGQLEISFNINNRVILNRDKFVSFNSSFVFYDFSKENSETLLKLYYVDKNCKELKSIIIKSLDKNWKINGRKFDENIENKYADLIKSNNNRYLTIYYIKENKSTKKKFFESVTFDENFNEIDKIESEVSEFENFEHNLLTNEGELIILSKIYKGQPDQIYSQLTYKPFLKGFILSDNIKIDLEIEFTSEYIGDVKIDCFEENKLLISYFEYNLSDKRNNFNQTFIDTKSGLIIQEIKNDITDELPKNYIYNQKGFKYKLDEIKENNVLNFAFREVYYNDKEYFYVFERLSKSFYSWNYKKAKVEKVITNKDFADSIQILSNDEKVYFHGDVMCIKINSNNKVSSSLIVNKLTGRSLNSRLSDNFLELYFTDFKSFYDKEKKYIENCSDLRDSPEKMQFNFTVCKINFVDLEIIERKEISQFGQYTFIEFGNCNKYKDVTNFYFIEKELTTRFNYKIGIVKY